ncbi:MAG: TRAP transporter substrate-binding protein [Firmicutes bacterium]|jgi:TRAP-type C4-dicarboxylate transport system substrate-binding protein|nr:TRAP transporter substrate-binding protein [Bacillota bacterium]
MKKKLAVLLSFAVIAVFSLAGCGGGDSGSGSAGSGEKAKFVVGHSMAEDTSFGKANAQLEKELEDSGLFDVEVYGASALGSEAEVIQSVQMGETQLYMTIAGTYSSFIPAAYVFDYQMPWIGNPDEGLEVLQAVYNDEEFSSYVKKQCEGSGLKVMGFSTLTYRTFTTNDKVQGFSDWKGMKLRTLENPIHMASINSWKATATPLAFGEVYAGLQQGLLDGQSNPVEPTYSSKLYEPQNYITNANHVWHVVIWTVSEESWNSYTEEQQKVLQTAIDNACQTMTDYCVEHNEEYLKYFADNGCDALYLPYETLKKMQESSQAANDMIAGDKYAGKEAYDLWMNKIEEKTKELGYDQSKETYEKYLKSIGELK